MQDDCYIGTTIIQTISTLATNTNKDILAAWAKRGKMTLIELFIYGVEFSSSHICFQNSHLILSDEVQVSKICHCFYCS